MSHRKTLSRLALAPLAVVAIAAPTAMAQPINDMHASTVQKPKPAKLDLRGEAAIESAGKPAAQTLPGPPTWPMHPEPITRATQAPVADSDGDGLGDVPVPLLIIAGTLVLGGGVTVARVRLGGTRPRAAG